jgi:hypothetical protein
MNPERLVIDGTVTPFAEFVELLDVCETGSQRAGAYDLEATVRDISCSVLSINGKHLYGPLSAELDWKKADGSMSRVVIDASFGKVFLELSG